MGWALMRPYMLAFGALAVGVLIVALALIVQGLAFSAWLVLGALLVADGIIRLAVINTDTADQA